MELIKEADLRKELKGEPRLGYLFFGEEDYLKLHAMRTAEELISPDETFAFFNVIRLDALDFTPSKLLEALMPMPMMADRKLITLTGLNFNTMRPSDLDDLCDTLSELSSYDYNLLIISVTADCLDPGYLPKKPSAVLKKLSEHLTPVHFESCTPARLSAWIGKHFEHNGVSVTPAFCAAMTDYCGRGMFQLANEIDKLSFYTLAHGKSTVTEADLREICTPVTEYDAFSFANALTENRHERALSILADYKLRRMDPRFIMGDIITVFCDLRSIYTMTANGASSAEISSVLKIHEFRVKLYQKSLRQTNEKQLNRVLDACVAADAALKNTTSKKPMQDYAILEKLICSI